MSNTTFLHLLQDNANNATVFQNLSNVDCIKNYGNSLVVGRRNIIAVTTSVNAGRTRNDTVLSVTTHSPADIVRLKDTLGWICEDLPGYVDQHDYPPKFCDFNAALKSASTWKTANQTIDYCLSERVSEQCKLQVSRTIMIVVICCNVVKMLCMFSMVRDQKQTLVTVG